MQANNEISNFRLDSNSPWVSFCIATCKRSDILEKTLKSIQAQEIDNFEVIISDNDPEQSSRDVVEGLNDSRFQYFYNDKNIGMVKNFNASLSYAKGEYVVLMADDDPPYKNFLSEIHLIYVCYPDYGAYYGACEVIMEYAEAAAAYNVAVGKIKCLSPVAEGTVRCFSTAEFPIKYFSGDVFPYILWSTGIVRRDIALEIGGMPDYGSPLLTDITYIAIAASHSGCVTVNKILGGQTVHGANSGLVDPHNIEIALKGSHQYLLESFSKRNNWSRLSGVIESYLCTYIASHCLAMDRYFAAAGNKAERIKLKKTLRKISEIPYIRGVNFQFNWPRASLFIQSVRLQGICKWSISFIRRILSSIKRSL